MHILWFNIQTCKYNLHLKKSNISATAYKRVLDMFITQKCLEPEMLLNKYNSNL